ncbi:MAG: hypothetical protein V4724_01995 [Pseudomonadota bacterium]
MARSFILAVTCIGIAGCGTTNNYLTEKSTTIEYYRIFDIKTSADRQSLAQAASKGLGRNVNNAQEVMPIPSSFEIPTVPGRFQLVDPLAGSRLAALAGGAGVLAPRIATCDGAVWTATADRVIERSNSMRLSACLFQYKGGYHLDLYAAFRKEEGGLLQFSRTMANAMVGTPEQWAEKTMLDVARSIKASSGGEVTLLEAQPAIAGTPWLDSLDTFRAAK